MPQGSLLDSGRTNHQRGRGKTILSQGIAREEKSWGTVDTAFIKWEGLEIYCPTRGMFVVWLEWASCHRELMRSNCSDSQFFYKKESGSQKTINIVLKHKWGVVEESAPVFLPKINRSEKVLNCSDCSEPGDKEQNGGGLSKRPRVPDLSLPMATWWLEMTARLNGFIITCWAAVREKAIHIAAANELRKDLIRIDAKLLRTSSRSGWEDFPRPSSFVFLWQRISQFTLAFWFHLQSLSPIIMALFFLSSSSSCLLCSSFHFACFF